MDAKLQSLLDEISEHGRENDARETERSRRMLNLDPETAQLVSILLRSAGAKRIVEIGTSNAYSTIWLAWSVGEGGRIVSVDRNPAKHELARENLGRADLLDRVTLRLGDAAEAARQIDGRFDALFLDADRGSFLAVFRLLEPKLERRALVLADNAISHASEIAEYLELISSRADFEHVLVPIGKGLSVAYRPA